MSQNVNKFVHSDENQNHLPQNRKTAVQFFGYMEINLASLNINSRLNNGNKFYFIELNYHRTCHPTLHIQLSQERLMHTNNELRHKKALISQVQQISIQTQIVSGSKPFEPFELSFKMLKLSQNETKQSVTG